MEDIKMDEPRSRTEHAGTEHTGIKDHLSSLTDNIEGLIKTFYRLTVVRITEKAVNVASGIVNALAVAVFAFLFLVFVCIGLALWLGDLMNSNAAGFLVMAGVFAIVIAALIILRKKTLFPLFRNMLVKKIYDNK